MEKTSFEIERKHIYFAHLNFKYTIGYIWLSWNGVRRSYDVYF